MGQQKQTLEYFKTHAKEWNDKANDQVYSVIENRHAAVLEVMGKYNQKPSLLDVGCGTGQLAIEASRRGWESVGIDFAAEMIGVCKENNEKAGTNAKFHCLSIFDAQLGEEAFDVVSAQGFIEYISLEQLDMFLEVANKALKRNGAIALGSRNRLFNLHSLNQFTELEAALGTVGKLLNEAILIQSARSQQEAVEALAKLRYSYEQPTEHPLTGVKVETRYQFSPADLVTKLAKHGFAPKSISPVHFHPLPISMLGDQVSKEVHKELAKMAAVNWIANHRLVPYSSSFVLEAVKQ